MPESPARQAASCAPTGVSAPPTRLRSCPRLALRSRGRRSARSPSRRTVLAVPADAALAARLRELLAAYPDVDVTDDAARRLEALEAERRAPRRRSRVSLVHHAELHVDGLGGELRPFQRAAVRYVLSQRRTFLADEQELGKTTRRSPRCRPTGRSPRPELRGTSAKSTRSSSGGYYGACGVMRNR